MLGALPNTFKIPVNGYPDSGAAGVPPDVVLGWRAGREAVTHDVYVSADEQAVIDGTVSTSTIFRRVQHDVPHQLTFIISSINYEDHRYVRSIQTIPTSQPEHTGPPTKHPQNGPIFTRR
ncbi:hypothetical protein ES703_29779 [subsurface metagenome]